jgi:L,D-transpeptidase ErfK/SrfK
MIYRFIILCFAVCLGFMIPAKAHAAYDKPYIGDMIEYEALYEDTFVYLARDYNLGFVEMRAANPDVDPWVPGDGRDLILPTRHLLPESDREGIVINLPEMRLYAFMNGEEAPDSYPIGVGREGLDTPVGKTKVVRKKEGPTWRPTPRMRKEDPELPAVVPPGPENPLGTHALYLGWPEYAIHGTNRPFGIGRRISSGCIRMYPEKIIELFEKIPTGTPVQVVNQPIKVAWIDDTLYLEAHPNLEQAIQMEEMGQVASPKLYDDDLKRIVKVAGEHKDRLRWPAIRTAIKERKGYPIPIARRSFYDADQENAESFGPAEPDESDIAQAKQELDEIYNAGESSVADQSESVFEPYRAIRYNQ